jgi:hypothetical protein
MDAVPKRCAKDSTDQTITMVITKHHRGSPASTVMAEVVTGVPTPVYMVAVRKNAQ